ncbi:hypothetical protein OIV83_004426 [Microbotryomycetes sp. JL201]|nr:hypothetical protein OIV83_004426 [Microbotryomycetes sp. JL201]
MPASWQEFLSTYCRTGPKTKTFDETKQAFSQEWSLRQSRGAVSEVKHEMGMQSTTKHKDAPYKEKPPARPGNCRNCQQPGHWARECPKALVTANLVKQADEQYSDDETASRIISMGGLAALDVDIVPESPSHYLGDRGSLSHYVEQKLVVLVADGHHVEAVGYGRLRLRFESGWEKELVVWHIPGAEHGILSVDALLDENIGSKLHKDEQSRKHAA